MPSGGAKTVELGRGQTGSRTFEHRDFWLSTELAFVENLLGRNLQCLRRGWSNTSSSHSQLGPLSQSIHSRINCGEHCFSILKDSFFYVSYLLQIFFEKSSLYSRPNYNAKNYHFLEIENKDIALKSIHKVQTKGFVFEVIPEYNLRLFQCNSSKVCEMPQVEGSKSMQLFLYPF